MIIKILSLILSLIALGFAIASVVKNHTSKKLKIYSDIQKDGNNIIEIIGRNDGKNEEKRIEIDNNGDMLFIKTRDDNLNKITTIIDGNDAIAYYLREENDYEN